jgi:HSP20 family protein
MEMNLVRWNPVREMFTLENEMNRLYNDILGRSQETEATSLWAPKVDIEESKDHYVLKAELPGIKQEDIKITLTDNQLVIRGEKRREVEQGDTTYHRVERVYGTFERAFTLTKVVRAEKIEALYRDGVLEVRVPKSEEAKAREIPIKTEK